MEILVEAEIINSQRLERLMNEATEILKIIASARKKVSSIRK